VNVDTGEFQALTERVERVEDALQAIARVEEIMRRANMPDELREVASQESARRSRHLRVVDEGLD
jgi:hypothetical protein